MRIEEAVTNPDDTKELARVVTALIQVTNRHLGFGDPIDSDTTPAQPNGAPDNVFGSWVRAIIDAVNVQVTFAHNLDIQATAVGTPNVYWPITSFRHSGLGSVGASPLQLVYEGGAITANSIQLVLQSAGARTVNVANPVTAVVFFAPSVGW